MNLRFFFQLTASRRYKTFELNFLINCTVFEFQLNLVFHFFFVKCGCSQLDIRKFRADCETKLFFREANLPKLTVCQRMRLLSFKKQIIGKNFLFNFILSTSKSFLLIRFYNCLVLKCLVFIFIAIVFEKFNQVIFL